MKLDIVTLMAAASLVAAIAALVLGGSWVLMRDRALAWWTAASTVQSIGIATLTYGFASLDPPTIAVGGAVTATSPTLVWAGIRAFCGRRIWFPVLLAGIIVIPAAAASKFAGEAQLSARLATFSVWVVFLLAATWELWRGRRELLRARWALMTLFTLHATIFAGGIIDNLVGNENVIGVPLTLKSWFGIIHFESLIYSMGTAVFMVVMCKERSELVYRKAARIDFLTGVTNRGAFMTQAGQMFTRCRRDAVPLTVAVFDLDNFKAINDTHGHRAGDRILQVFAESALKVLRANDLLGRHGGEDSRWCFPPRPSRPAMSSPNGSGSGFPRPADSSIIRFRRR